MPAFVAGLPSPVLRDFPLPAKVSMMPTAMTLLSIDCPSPQSATSCLRRLRRRRGGRRRRDSRLGPRRPVRRDRLLDLRLLRAGLRFDGVRFMHRLLEALDGFAQPFAKLRELAGPKMINTMKRIRTSSVMPMLPNIARSLVSGSGYLSFDSVVARREANRCLSRSRAWSASANRLAFS